MRLRLLGESRSVEFLLVPEEIEVSEGTRTISLDTLAQTVEQPAGRKGIPTRYSWSGILVGRARTRRGSEHMDRRRWTNPQVLDQRLRNWTRSGRRLRLVATDTRIRGPVFISSYRSTVSGGYGDIRYTIELVEWRNIRVKRKGKGNKGDKRDGGGGGKKKGARGGDDGGGGGKSRSTYTVKGGDTLGSISRKFLGSVTRWREIYKIPRNRKTIGPNPDQLKPGQVLVIPDK